MVVVAPKTQTTLTGLKESTCYSISVSASTIKGDGSSSYIKTATGKNNEFPFSGFDVDAKATAMTNETKTLSKYNNNNNNNNV